MSAPASTTSAKRRHADNSAFLARALAAVHRADGIFVISRLTGGAMRKVRVAPKAMGLNDFVAAQEGFFAAEGIEVEWDLKTFRGTQSSWKGSDYFQRPQDQPYMEGDKSLIQCACVWGSISNASAGMGRFVPDCYGVSPWSVFVRQESRIRRPEDLKDAPVSVGLRAGSHFNVPFRLKKYLPLWEKCVPPEFKQGYAWDYSRFTRGERFVYQPLPRADFDMTLEQVKRWQLDDYLKERSFEKLVYRAPATV